MAGADRFDRALLPRWQEGAFFDVTLYREFIQLPEFSRIPVDADPILTTRGCGQ